MFNAAFKALAQMFTPPFRAVLLKSVGLAILVLILLGIGLQRLFAWLAGQGAGYLEGVSGPGLQGPLHALLWVLAIIAGFGLVAGAIFVMPAVSAFVASFFSDEIAAEVEHAHYPADPPGAPVPLWTAEIEGLKTALLALLVYLFAVPFLLFAGLGFLIFFVANAFLLGREYFLLAAMRFHSVEEAKRAAQAAPRHDHVRRLLHRGVRVDPDPESGDAAVRHGVHGARAQAAGGTAPRADRAHLISRTI